MKTSDTFLNAADLLAEKSRWCKGRMAKDQDGFSVTPSSTRAIQFCAVGAVRHISRKNTLNDLELKYLKEQHRDPVGFNDSNSTEHSDVVNLLLTAALLALADGK